MSEQGRRRAVEIATFVVFLVGITVIFGAVLLPFAGAILWSVVAAIVFMPVFDRIHRRMPARQGTAASLTLLVFAAMVIVPTLFLVTYMIEEGTGLYLRFSAGQIDLGAMFDRFERSLPGWVQGVLGRIGVTDLDSATSTLGKQISARAQSLAQYAVSFGQGFANFLLALAVMLYITFFLLRDGRAINDSVGERVPMEPTRRRLLARRFVAVVRATVKGSIVVAVVQGALGAITMALLGVPNAVLWGVVMAFAALLPAVGPALVWVPVVLYLIVAGQVWQAIAMALSGALLIGSADNVLRPILVGRETQMPDYLVLVSTLGGLATFGVNGLLIGPVAAALFMSAWDVLSNDPIGEIADQ